MSALKCRKCGENTADPWVLEEPGWGMVHFFCSARCLFLWATLRYSIEIKEREDGDREG